MPNRASWDQLINFSNENYFSIGFLQPKESDFPEDSFYLNTTNSQLALSEEYQRQTRPSLLLGTPTPLCSFELSSIKIISHFPRERIESSWWELSEKECSRRDYFLALSKDDQMLWIFQDRMTSQYYLHGYFD